MNHHKFLILGGYGNTGRPVAQLLLQYSDVRLVLVGRSSDKAMAAAAELNDAHPGERVIGLAADAADPASLVKAFQGIDLVIVASSTSQYTQQVAKTALESGIDYLDVQFSSSKLDVLKSMQQEIEAAGRCFITEGGFHPGLPAALVRYATLQLDVLEKANVGSVIKIDWAKLDVADSTLDELIAELNSFSMLLFKDGQWKKASMTSTADFLKMDFGPPFGKQSCAPMFLEEMRALPELYPDLKETGFYVGSFNWFVDWVVMPISMLALRIWPRKAVRPMGRLMRWGLNTFSKPPYGVLLKLEAQGKKVGKDAVLELIVSHPDGYFMTAAPVVACLLQYLDGSIRKPGLWMQANLIEPSRLMNDLERMGVSIQVSQSP
jgi:hypothetical protein